VHFETGAIFEKSQGIKAPPKSLYKRYVPWTGHWLNQSRLPKLNL